MERNENWERWISYFLQAVIEQSSVNINKVEAILKLHKEMLDKVQNITHSQYTHKIVDFLLSNPWFTSVSFREVSGVPKPSAARMLQILSENKILTLLQRGKGKRPGYFAFSSLLKILNNY